MRATRRLNPSLRKAVRIAPPEYPTPNRSANSGIDKNLDPICKLVYIRLRDNIGNYIPGSLSRKSTKRFRLGVSKSDGRPLRFRGVTGSFNKAYTR